MKRSTTMRRWLPATAMLMLLMAAAWSGAAEKPNVVLMMADDLGYGDVGYHGHARIRTPHLDEMARASLKLERFYAASAVCSPTRGSALTGRHPHRYGITNANAGHLPPGEITLAEILREHGYATGHFGKWHLGTLTTTEKDANRGRPGDAAHFSPPQANGFDVCFSTESKVPTWDPMIKPRGKSDGGYWDAMTQRQDAVTYGTAYWNEKGEKVTENLDGDDSKLIMDRALAFIGSAQKAGRPWFSVIWFHAPHLPVVAGGKFLEMYRGEAEYERNYYGCISAMDEQVGRLRAELRKMGAAENTLIFFAADNGPEGQAGKAPGSAGGLRGRKRDLFEGGVRVPGLVEWPAVVKAGTTDVACVTSDYLPTVVEILGAKLPEDRVIDGVSLLPLLRGEMTERPRPIGFEFAGQSAWSDNRYKIIRIAPAPGSGNGKGKGKGKKAGGPGWMLFDLAADPAETKDLAAEKPDILHRMTTDFETWRRTIESN